MSRFNLAHKGVFFVSLFVLALPFSSPVTPSAPLIKQASSASRYVERQAQLEASMEEMRDLILLEQKNASLLISQFGGQVDASNVIMEMGIRIYDDSRVDNENLDSLTARERSLRSAMSDVIDSHEQWVTSTSQDLDGATANDALSVSRLEDRYAIEDALSCPIKPIPVPNEHRFMDTAKRLLEGQLRDLSCDAISASTYYVSVTGQVVDEALLVELNTAINLASGVDSGNSLASISQHSLYLSLTMSATQDSHGLWVEEEVRKAEEARRAEEARKAEEARVAAEQAAAEAARAAATTHTNRGGATSSQTPQQYLEGIAGAYNASISWSDAPCDHFAGGIGGCYQGGSTVYVSIAAYGSWSTAKGRGRNVVLHEVSHMIIQWTCGTVLLGGKRFENVTDAYTVLLGGGETGYGYNDNDMALASAAVGGKCLEG